MVIMKIPTISFKTLLLALLLAGISATAFAYSFTVDGIYYNISSSTDKTVSVTYKNSNIWSGEYRDTVIIPETVTYNDITYTVVRVGYAAFNTCKYLKAVHIPNTVTSIDEMGLASCPELTSVNIPEGVTRIGKSAFAGLPKLEGDMVLPSTLTTIGESAFNNCSGFTHVNIPASVTSIGDGAFGGCTGITSWTVDAGNPVYDSRDGCNAIIHTATNTLVIGCKNTYIPYSVTSIANSAFSGLTGLVNVNIPNSVTSIGSRAFYNCTDLTSVTIPDGITIINKYTFERCENLINVNIPNTVKIIDTQAFRMCSSLQSIMIPASVDSEYVDISEYRNIANEFVTRGLRSAGSNLVLADRYSGG